MMQVDAPMIDAGNQVFQRETDYRFSRFMSWCPQLAGNIVGLYGSGANARRILEFDARPFEIQAVADDSAVGTEICGMQVVGLEDVPGQGIDTLVVAAEFRSAIAVIRRIRSFCRENGIRVFDMYGNDMLELDGAMSEILDQPLAEQLRSIEHADALCINLGLFTEGRAVKTIADCLHGKGRLDQCLNSVIEFAGIQGKEILFYSDDDRVTRDGAKSLLQREGLADAGEVLLSSECSLYAENGLFRKLYESVPAERVIHIGPDLFIDCFVPLAYGAHAVLTGHIVLSCHLWCSPGPEPFAFQGEWFEAEVPKPPCPADERLRACSADVIPEICAQAEEQVARAVSVIGPLVVAYATWLVSRLGQEGGSYPAVLFSSRDGYLPKAVYEEFLACCDDASLPPALYFYTSRMASAAAAGNGGHGFAQRSNTLRHYMASGLVPGQQYAFVEFVGAGTCQSQLECFVPFGLRGFYFASRMGDCLSRWLDSEFYFDEQDLSFLSRYLRLEPYLSSDEPSLEGFDESGDPVFAQELRSEDELVLLRKVQEHVIGFAREYFTNWYQQGDVVSHAYANAFVTALDACDADALSLYNDLNGVKLPLQIGCLPPFTLDERSDAPEDSETREAEPHDERDKARSRLLSILAAFDAVCDEFGLAYIATHGTMLGAIREGGLIASDDDLDVAMPRADYDKLLELAEAGVFPEPFFLQTPENDASFFSGGFAKLWRMSPESGGEESDGSRSFEGCVWMDILPLDNCPRDDAAVERRQRVIRSLQRTLYVQTYGLDFSKIWDTNPKKLSAYFILAERVSRAHLCRLLKRACSSCDSTGLLTVFAGNYRWQRNELRYEAADVEHAIRIPFEDMSIPVPRNAEQWLESHYGPGWREDEGSGI